MNFTSGELNLLITVHPEGGGGKCASRLNPLSAGWSSSSLMSVYACSQEVVITGDGGVTQSAGADGDGGPKTTRANLPGC